MSHDKKWDKLKKIIDKEYPEAYMYFALGKLFGWGPNIIDELDIRLCYLLIDIETKRNEDEADELEKAKDGKSSTRPISKSMPDEWKTMSVKDILQTSEFKSRQEDNQNLLKAMKNTHGGQTEVVKNFIKIE